jgi:phosphoribosyl 1,2-cyclic phosphodiesterase
LKYKILSSGSQGNCVIINGDIMFDCGIPYKKMKNDLYDVKYLIITHVHTDHLKLETLLQIMRNFPRIQIIGNYEVHQAAMVNHIANAGHDIKTEDYIFTPFECFHDVLTYGYTFQIGEDRIIYCTDTSSLENAPKDQYDYFFLESNHDEAKLEQARNQKKGRYDPYMSGKRHLSTQAAKAFYYTYRRSKDSELIELHKSSRFY